MTSFLCLVYVTAVLNAGVSQSQRKYCHRKLLHSRGVVSYPDPREQSVVLPKAFKDDSIDEATDCVYFTRVRDKMFLEFSNLSLSNQAIKVQVSDKDTSSGWRTKKLIVKKKREFQRATFARRSRARIIFHRKGTSFTLRYMKSVWNHRKGFYATLQRPSKWFRSKQKGPDASKGMTGRQAKSRWVKFRGKASPKGVPGVCTTNSDGKCIFSLKIPQANSLGILLTSYNIPYFPLLLEYYTEDRGWRLGLSVTGMSICPVVINVTDSTRFRMTVPLNVKQPLRFRYEILPDERGLPSPQSLDADPDEEFECPAMPSNVELVSCTKPRGNRKCIFKCKNGYFPTFIDAQRYPNFTSECRILSGTRGAWLPPVNLQSCESKKEISGCFDEDSFTCFWRQDALLTWFEGAFLSKSKTIQPSCKGDYDEYAWVYPPGGDGAIKAKIQKCIIVCSPMIPIKLTKENCSPYCGETNCSKRDKPHLCLSCNLSKSSPCKYLKILPG